MTNGYSDPILELRGPEVGVRVRSSIGMQIPLNPPANCEAEVAVADERRLRREIRRPGSGSMGANPPDHA